MYYVTQSICATDSKCPPPMHSRLTNLVHRPILGIPRSLFFDSYLELCSTSRLREGAQRHELQYLVPKMDAVEAASGVKLIG